MDLDELRAFLAVAETGSILAAADSLALARTTLRRRIDDLEARFGAPLLFRGAQGATLTPAGELVAARGRRILEEASALLSSVRDAGDTASGVARVAIPVGMPPHALLPIFAACRANHPQLAIEAHILEDPLSALSDGVDLVVHFGPRVPSGSWVTRVLLHVREIVVGSAAYLAARGTPRTPADLAHHELMAWQGPATNPCAWPVLGGAPVAVAPVFVTSDIHMLRQLALEGHGLAFVPDALLPDPGVAKGTLVQVLPEFIGRDCPVRVVVPEPLTRSPKVRALQEGILAFFGEP